MMISSKFGIGQQVRHKLLGYLGVIVDIDAEYSLDQPEEDDIASNMNLRSAPWYHVVMEDDNGEPIHSYLAEAQITYEMDEDHPDNITMDELAESIRNQLQSPGCAINNTKSPATHMPALFLLTFPAPDAGSQFSGSDPQQTAARRFPPALSPHC